MIRLWTWLVTFVRQTTCNHYPEYVGLEVTARGRCVVARCTKCGKEEMSRNTWRVV